MAKESPEEKLSALIEGILDARDKKKAEEADPKLRNDRLMARMEAFLDEHEAAKAKPAKPAEKKDDDGETGIFGLRLAK